MPRLRFFPLMSENRHLDHTKVIESEIKLFSAPKYLADSEWGGGGFKYFFKYFPPFHLEKVRG